tara:strand:+ start:2060 stop:2551 length:492 start_codon:yes stop_codon:yes gene_type:complete
MKKNSLIIVSFLLLIFINACSGYKPIFSSANFNFIIADYEIMGDKVLGNQIYLKLRNISSTNKTDDIQNFKIFINASKEKKSTVKDSAGKILEYKITLNTNIIINDFLTDEEILKQEFSIHSNYKVQDQHSETKNLENKNLENLIDRTHQDILIRISEKISKK